MADLQHAIQVHLHFVLGATIAVVGEHKLAENVLDGSHIDGKFVINALSSLICNIAIEGLRALFGELLLDISCGDRPRDLKVNDPVRDDLHALQRESLNASAGESLHDPALALLLVFGDFFLDEVNNDVIIN